MDDSAFMRKLISEFVSTHPKMEVVGTARNGLDALTKLENIQADIITLDVEMPVMDGIQTLKELIKKDRYEMIMLSSVTKTGAEQTIEAMENGAFDFISKPSGAISLDLHIIRDTLCESIIAAYQKTKRKQTKNKLQTRPLKRNKKKIFLGSYDLVVIGTSTGGPKALQEVLPTIPKAFRSPIIIVQHMPAGYTNTLAKRLNQMCRITVKEAEDGDILENGVAYIAPGGKHLEIIEVENRKKIIKLIDKKSKMGLCPSIDITLESIAKLKKCNVLTVIMTGMGNDGTKGLKQLRKKQSIFTIAESEETAVVFGMPRAAIRAGVIDEIYPLYEIGSKLIQQVNVMKGE